uniref:Uncharacterized protein n=1 Tax=Oryza rufipogon TaxID=4529 RepID=A0A0E0RG57_ORYRU
MAAGGENGDQRGGRRWRDSGQRCGRGSSGRWRGEGVDEVGGDGDASGGGTEARGVL